MNFDAFATDYDGTLAHDGRVDDATLEAVRRAHRAGLRLLLVTGRELSDLSNTFADVSLFDLVVAENGAQLFDPKTEAIRLLAPPPPVALVEWLTRRNVPLSVGHSIVATVEPHEHMVLEALRELGLEWHIVFNKGSVMVLPSNVTKATGLKPALEQIGVAPARTVGIGDAENDLAFLGACGLAVAVANALESVKENADVVTAGARGAGVAECIDRLLTGEFDSLATRQKGVMSDATSIGTP
jgi:hydroxymethylpyrimidine pyrophosphatase-like HAD family hydrolase